MRIDRNQTWDKYGNLLHEEIVERPQLPLDAAGVAATLNVVLGLWPLQDAANAVNCHPDELIAEAQAWAVAGK